MGQYTLLDDTDRFSDEISAVLYEKTDEKAVLAAALEQHLQNKHYSRMLDVGAGPGLISMPLYQHCDQLTLLEVLPEYQAPLQQQFPNAEVKIGSIETAEFEHSFDVILFAHVIYYFPMAQWTSIIQKLISLLSPGGELLVAVWDVNFIYGLFMRKLKGLHSVEPIIPIADLTTLFSQYAQVTVKRLPTTMIIDSDDQLIDLVWHMLGVKDRADVAACVDEFEILKSHVVEENGQRLLKTDNVLMTCQ